MSGPILTTSVPKPAFNLSAAVVRVAGLTGRSSSQIGLDVVRLMLGRQKLRPEEYFIQGAWLGNGAEFVGATSNLRLNESLTDRSRADLTSLLNDKYLTGLVLEAHGFPVPALRAVYAADRSFGQVPTLRTAEALADWISTGSGLPAFAKPVDGSMALGSVPLRSGVGGQVDIGAREVEPVALAREVAQAFPRGWLVQELLQQPEEIEALIGPGVGTVRVVTLWEASGPEVLYAVWRHPAVGTWVDAAIFGKPNVGCALDPRTGEVTAARLGDLFQGREITQSLVTPDRALVGCRLPGWSEVVRICNEGHRLFPGHALLGWDIGLTDRGPVISELNANPLHMSYQRAFKRGFLHPEHVTRLDAARALMRARVGAK